MALHDELTAEEYDRYQRTGVLPPAVIARMREENLQRTREANERLANLDRRADPTLRDSIHAPAPTVHDEQCDMDEYCQCPASDEQIERSFDAYR